MTPTLHAPVDAPAPVSVLVPVQTAPAPAVPAPVDEVRAPVAPVSLARRAAMPVLGAGLVGCLALYSAIAFLLLRVVLGLVTGS